MRRVWILNLDAERELAAQGSYDTPQRLAAQIAQESQKVRDALCPNEALLGSTDHADTSPGCAVAWCPTPSARRAADRARLAMPAAPSVDVLRRVNHRRFALELARCAEVRALSEALPSHREASLAFEGARLFVDAASSKAGDFAWLEARAPFDRGFRLKRSYGFAGRGQRRIAAPLRDDDRRWLSDALRLGGFACEPEVALTSEISQHGYVDNESSLLGAPCALSCDRFGAPLSITRLAPGSLDSALAKALEGAASALTAALRAAGYFGPFGLDSRIFDSTQGPGVTLIGDVNARFTMGWSIGMGEQREDALARLSAVCP